MISYQTVILKFENKGEKTGWTYIDVPADIAERLSPGNKRSFRVRGRIDTHPVEGISLLPMGTGNFIMPLNAVIRKAIGKRHGAMVKAVLEHDPSKYSINTDLLECLRDEPDAEAFFNTLTVSHRNYFSKWIESAKTDETYARRIAQTVTAMIARQDYGQMLRSLKRNHA